MPKRSGTYSTRRSKRQKIASDSGSEDETVAQSTTSFSAISTRRVPSEAKFPSLATICARVFVHHFRDLSNASNWSKVSKWLEVIPNAIAAKIFAMLREKHPSFLTHSVITTYFLRGDAVDLTGALGVTLATLRAIPRVSGSTLRVLRLEDLTHDKFPDKIFAETVSRLPALESLHLRNCPSVGPVTVEAAAHSCPHLRSVNFSYTSVTPTSIRNLLDARPELEVLKLAGIKNFSDATLHKALSSFTHTDRSPFRNLRTLKLRENNISETTIIPILRQCPLLERLDLSFTLLQHLPRLSVYPPLEKLALTSTYVPISDLVETVQNCPKLKTLNIGALGFKPESSLVAKPVLSEAMLLDDKALAKLTDALANCPEIESMNLVQNAKLATSLETGLHYFIEQIGRKCKYLNLSGIPNLLLGDLAGLVPAPGMDVSPLKTLLLNRTGIGDESGDASEFLASCTNLEVLEVAETKMTAEDLFPVIDACPRLSKLNITRCRGIRLVDRRRFFEVWEEQRRE